MGSPTVKKHAPAKKTPDSAKLQAAVRARRQQPILAPELPPRKDISVPTPHPQLIDPRHFVATMQVSPRDLAAQTLAGGGTANAASVASALPRDADPHDTEVTELPPVDFSAEQGTRAERTPPPGPSDEFDARKTDRRKVPPDQSDSTPVSDSAVFDVEPGSEARSPSEAADDPSTHQATPPPSSASGSFLDSDPSRHIPVPPLPPAHLPPPAAAGPQAGSPPSPAEFFDTDPERAPSFPSPLPQAQPPDAAVGFSADLLTDDMLVRRTITFCEQKGIVDAKGLMKESYAFYMILKKRGVLDDVLAAIAQSRTAVSGSVARAATQFAGASPPSPSPAQPAPAAPRAAQQPPSADRWRNLPQDMQALGEFIFVDLRSEPQSLAEYQALLDKATAIFDEQARIMGAKCGSEDVFRRKLQAARAELTAGLDKRSRPYDEVRYIYLAKVAIKIDHFKQRIAELDAEQSHGLARGSLRPEVLTARYDVPKTVGFFGNPLAWAAWGSATVGTVLYVTESFKPAADGIKRALEALHLHADLTPAQTLWGYVAATAGVISVSEVWRRLNVRSEARYLSLREALVEAHEAEFHGVLKAFVPIAKKYESNPKAQITEIRALLLENESIFACVDTLQHNPVAFEALQRAAGLEKKVRSALPAIFYEAERNVIQKRLSGLMPVVGDEAARYSLMWGLCGQDALFARKLKELCDRQKDGEGSPVNPRKREHVLKFRPAGADKNFGRELMAALERDFAKILEDTLRLSEGPTL